MGFVVEGPRGGAGDALDHPYLNPERYSLMGYDAQWEPLPVEAGVPLFGLRPPRREDRTMFSHTWTMCAGQMPPEIQH